MVMGFWKIPTCQWDGHYTSMVPSGNSRYARGRWSRSEGYHDMAVLLGAGVRS